MGDTLVTRESSKVTAVPLAGCATPASSAPTFSIGVLVTDFDQYRRLRESLGSHGFNQENSEFFYVDNSNGNVLDGYSGIRAFLCRATGEYLIVVHQDIVLIDDGAYELSERLAELDEVDPDWALAGNAGVSGIGGWAMRISDPHIDDAKIGELPARVNSLDENFIVIKRSSLVSPSTDLHGFHFYGTDLCLQAQLKGMSAYVVDFHLRHFGKGVKSESYYQALKDLERKYQKIGRIRIVQTTCDLVFLCWPNWLRPLRNSIARLLRVSGMSRGRWRRVHLPSSKVFSGK